MNPRAARVIGVVVAGVAVAVFFAIGSGGGGNSSSTSSTSDVSFFEESTVSGSLDRIEEELGSDTRLESFDLSDDHVTFIYLVHGTDELQAFSLFSDSDSLEKASIIGGKHVKDAEAETYPVSEVDPAAPAKIEAAAPKAAGVPDYQVALMSLSVSSTKPGQLEWSIVSDKTGEPVLLASADGSRVFNPAK